MSVLCSTVRLQLITNILLASLTVTSTMVTIPRIVSNKTVLTGYVLFVEPILFDVCTPC